MTFRAPLWLWLAAAAPLVLVFLIARERTRTRIARRFVSERLRGVANPLRVAAPVSAHRCVDRDRDRAGRT